jgi:predicted small secreted protein
MTDKRRLLGVVPGLCAALIILRLTVLKTPSTSDVGLGVSIGILVGISILSVILHKRPTP